MSFLKMVTLLQVKMLIANFYTLTKNMGNETFAGCDANLRILNIRDDAIAALIAA